MLGMNCRGCCSTFHWGWYCKFRRKSLKSFKIIICLGLNLWEVFLAFKRVIKDLLCISSYISVCWVWSWIFLCFRVKNPCLQACCSMPPQLTAFIYYVHSLRSMNAEHASAGLSLRPSWPGKYSNTTFLRNCALAGCKGFGGTWCYFSLQNQYI